jgi:hypothetical protein
MGVSTLALPEERWAWWGGVALLWAALWIVLVAAL